MRLAASRGVVSFERKRAPFLIQAVNTGNKYSADQRGSWISLIETEGEAVWYKRVEVWGWVLEKEENSF